MEEVLLHACCAPCSAPILEWMLANGIRPTIFYYNPNIYPREEYDIRRDECSRYARRLGLEMVEGEYDHAAWQAAVAGLEREPERGKRCSACFRMRLLATAKMAQEKGFERIATTLGSSRWKNIAQIAEAGNGAVSQVEGVSFWDRNWRKGGLQERRRILLAENGFYNQQYCGCEYSLGDRG